LIIAGNDEVATKGGLPQRKTPAEGWGGRRGFGTSSITASLKKSDVATMTRSGTDAMPKATSAREHDECANYGVFRRRFISRTISEKQDTKTRAMTKQSKSSMS